MAPKTGNYKTTIPSNLAQADSMAFSLVGLLCVSAPLRLKRPTLLQKRAFTLVELMVVVVLIGIMSAAIIPQMKGTFHDALLHSTSRQLRNAFDIAYSRAVSLNQAHRVRIDTHEGRCVIERRVGDGARETFVPVNDFAAAELNLDKRVSVELHSTDTASSESTAPGQPEASPPVQAIVFYPDGTADATDVLLRDPEGFPTPPSALIR